MAEDLHALIDWIRGLQANPPTSAQLRAEINELAAQVARETGASVRVSESGSVRVRFAGRNAITARVKFQQLAAERAPQWARKVAADVVGKLP